MRFSIGGCVEKSVWTALFTLAGTMKKAFIARPARRSCVGTRCIAPEIFIAPRRARSGGR